MEIVTALVSGENGWGWLILAAILFALDINAPGFFLVWFALAAAAVGALLFAVPIPNPWPMVAFSAASVLSLFLGRALWGSHRERKSDRPFLNQRSRQLIGQTFVLTDPIEGGRGRIKVGDTVWSVNGPDMPAGEMVRVNKAEGMLLTVEAAENGPSLPKAGSFAS